MESGAQVRGDDIVPLFRLGEVRGLQQQRSHEVHGTVDPAEALDRASDGPVDGQRVTRIPGQGLGAGALRELLQTRRVAAADQQRGAALGEALAQRLAHAARRAKDQVGRGCHRILLWTCFATEIRTRI